MDFFGKKDGTYCKIAGFTLKKLLRQYKISVLHIPGNLEQFVKQPPYRSSFFTTADNTINASTLGSTIN